MGGLKKLLSGDSNVGRENSARIKKQSLAYWESRAKVWKNFV